MQCIIMEDQELIQSSTVVAKTQENIIHKEVSPFPAGDHKAARNRQDSITKIKMNLPINYLGQGRHCV